MQRYYIRASWGIRPQSISHSATIIVEFMKKLQTFNSYFSKWYSLRNKNIYSPWEEILPTEEQIINKIKMEFPKRNQPDIHTFLSEGHNLLMSNSDDPNSNDSITFSLGWSSKKVNNSVQIDITISEQTQQFLEVSSAVKLLEIMAIYWNPAFVTFSSTEILNTVYSPSNVGKIQTGWLTYIRQTDINFPDKYKTYEIGESGIIVQVSDSFPSLSDNCDMQKVLELDKIINQVGLNLS